MSTTPLTAAFHPKEAYLLEVFRDFAVRGRDAPVILDRLRQHPPSGCRVDDQATEELDRQSSGETHLVFRIESHDDQPSAKVFLLFIGEELRVTNIVPDKVTQLSKRQYNQLVEELNDWVRNLGVGASVEATMTPDRLDVATLLNAETAKALKAFSALANKNTGASHPLDRDRWFKFITLAHLGSAKLDTETLYRWFSEEEGWPDDQPRFLATIKLTHYPNPPGSSRENAGLSAPLAAVVRQLPESDLPWVAAMLRSFAEKI